jgi:hypothetical protein
MTGAEKMEAILKWTENRKKLEKKKGDKSSHVHCYMHREIVPGSFYSEVKKGNGPKIL